jgi:predicted metal-dependent enzyme (double-stranded beta helix superfamily)
MNCFNLDDHRVEKEIRFEPARLALSPGKTYQFSGATFSRSGDVYVGKVSIPAVGHTLVEVT